MTIRTLAVAGFLALLTGCMTTAPARVEKMYPPASLLEDCKAGPMTFEDNEALTASVLALARALKLCNLDKAMLREWSQDKI